MPDRNKNEIRKILFEKLRQRRGGGIALRMTSMIDVIFLLLIFFLVTAKFRPQEDILPVVLPDVAAASEGMTLVEPLVINLESVDEGMKIGIPGADDLVIGKESFDSDMADFVSSLGEVFVSQNRTKADPVELRCADNLKWQHLAKVYNVLYGMGLTDITFPME